MSAPASTSALGQSSAETLAQVQQQQECDRRQQLRQWLESCRAATLGLFEDVDDATFRKQAHPEFSPAGWHLGHIAYIEASWILERLAGLPPQFPQYHRLFAADGLPKAERSNLPGLLELQDYLTDVRQQVLAYLETAPLDHQQERLWRWLLQHESQHNETITLVLQLQRWRQNNGRLTWEGDRPLPNLPPTPAQTPMICIPAGYFEQGNSSLNALDNERMVHPVYLETYWIDRYPVTCRQYRAFMAAGGYQESGWWSPTGWEWLQQHPVSKPLYWSDHPEWDDHPVCGVSWYEAEAYANFVNKRLPTEAEWEKAASWDAHPQKRRTYPWGETFPLSQHCNHDHWIGHTTPVHAYPDGQSASGCDDMLGNVWEWTADWFQGYTGFQPYPYTGYSQAYFDNEHRVLRGGSWATRPWALRCAFRNWYHPGVRQILAGFRCVRSGEA